MKNLRRLAPYLWRQRLALVRGLVYLCITAALAAASPWVLRVAIDEVALTLTAPKCLAVAVGCAVLAGQLLFNMALQCIGRDRPVSTCSQSATAAAATARLRLLVVFSIVRLPPDLELIRN